MNFCGNTLPSPVTYRSHGNQMFVRMRTDQSVSARGFKADYVTGNYNITSEKNILSCKYRIFYLIKQVPNDHIRLSSVCKVHFLYIFLALQCVGTSCTDLLSNFVCMYLIYTLYTDLLAKEYIWGHYDQVQGH